MDVKLLKIGSNLPVLIGSEKQIAWAEKLRRSVINGCRYRLDQLYELMQINVDSVEVVEALHEQYDKEKAAMKKMLEGTILAGFYIDNRKKSLEELLKMFM